MDPMSIDMERLASDFIAGKIAIRCKNWIERRDITRALIESGVSNGDSGYSKRFAAGEEIETERWFILKYVNGIEYGGMGWVEGFNVILFDELHIAYPPEEPWDVDEASFLNIIGG